MTLHYDRRTKAWVEKPKTLLQELNEKTDDYIGGMIVGVGIGGFLAYFIIGLAYLVSLL